MQPYENPQQIWRFFIEFVDQRKGGSFLKKTNKRMIVK